MARTGSYPLNAMIDQPGPQLPLKAGASLNVGTIVASWRKLTDPYRFGYEWLVVTTRLMFDTSV
jgi:hypothetical protein